MTDSKMLLWIIENNSLQKNELNKILFKTWLMALAQVLLGLAPITFFLDEKICNHCEHDPFFSNFSPVFEIPDSLDWFKKNETKLKQNSNNFNHSLFFPSKSCFSLLLIIVLQRNMRSLWTWPFFSQNSVHFLSFQTH